MRAIGRSIVLLLLGTGMACTGSEAPRPTASPTTTLQHAPPAVAVTPSPSPSGIAPSGPEPYVLDVIADLSPAIGDVEATNSFVDGMRLAVDDVNAVGGVDGRPLALALHDHHGSPEEAAAVLGQVLDRDPLAVLFVGPGTAVTPLRARIEEVGAPLILLEGDLYTGRGLFRQVFQTTLPWEWQATTIARYVVTDREAKDVVFVGEGPEAPAAESALRAALQYWGGSLAAGFTDEDLDPTTGPTPALDRAARSDWTVAFGPPVTALDLVNAVEEVAGIGDVATSRPAPGITGPAGLLVPAPGVARPEPGTSAPYPYTWSGWARPIARVREFRRTFKAAFGRLPLGLEQEGYDAVRALRWALKVTGGRGGADLVDALEGMDEQTYSGFPIHLGPDDHLFAPRDNLGLFAVAGPNERLDPWQAAGSEPWRPIMRSFTTDGERNDILDLDRKVFFPFWEKDQPGPEYWRSRFGIVTKPSDPLH